MFRWGSRFRNRFSPVGLDLGSVQIKLVQFRHERGQIIVHRRGIFPLEDGVIEQGRVADGEALSRQLRQIFKELKLKRRDTFLCVGNNTVILRSFTLPAMSPVEIAAAVRWEAARYHPVPDEMITDYIVTGERSSNGKRVVETGVVSVLREIVAGYLEPVSRAGFRPAGVEIEPLALCRAARFFTGTGDGKRLLLDIGEENSILVIIEEGRYLFSRFLNFGARHLHGHGSNVHEVVAKKTAGWTGVAAGFGETVDGPIAQVHRALEYYAYQAPESGGEFNELLLFGGGAAAGLASFMDDERMPEPAVFTFHKENDPVHEPVPSAGGDSLFGVAGGLALRGWINEKGY